jgi:hypothetical protein
VWLKALGAAIAGALLGGVWSGFGDPWAQGHLQGLLRAVASWLRSAVQAASAWLRHPTEVVANMVEAVMGDLRNRIAAAPAALSAPGR